MKRTSKKILMVSTETSDVFIVDLGLRLVDKGYDVWRFFVLDGVLLHYNTGNQYPLIHPKNQRDVVSVFRASLQVRKFLKSVDVIHYHFITFILYPVVFAFRKMEACKKCASIWGSDYYKLSRLVRTLNYFLYYNFDAISFANSDTLNSFAMRYPKLSRKLHAIAFGLNPLDDIDALLIEENRIQSKEKLGLSNFDKVVCIGTNASSNQNHLDILEGLNLLEPLTKKSVFFVIPLAYPKGATEYISQIHEATERIGLENFSLETAYVSGKDLARQRVVPDILIQLQNTDQFSGVMQEVMYAGGEVITGSWLPYDVLKENNMYYRTVSDIQQIAHELESSLKRGITEEEKNKNKRGIQKLSSWDNLITKWEDLYN